MDKDICGNVRDRKGEIPIFSYLFSCKYYVYLIGKSDLFTDLVDHMSTCGFCLVSLISNMLRHVNRTVLQYVSHSSLNLCSYKRYSTYFSRAFSMYCCSHFVSGLRHTSLLLFSLALWGVKGQKII